MTNQEMRSIVEQLDINLFKINYKTGVHYGVIEDFFKGRSETMSATDRMRIEEMLSKEVRKAK